MTENEFLRAVRHGLGLGASEVRADDPGYADDAAATLFAIDEDFSLAGATEWLNSPPLTGTDLRGRVVLVDFGTYTCINWLRSLPYVRAWDERYRPHGLVVIGVHSPEFTFEHDLDNVRREVRARAITFPVAVDNDFAVWRSFKNHYWPALYLVDAQGRIRHHRAGEGGYGETEEVIRRLLADAGAGDLGKSASVAPQGIEAAADWDDLRTPETYVGYDRTENFASPGGIVPDAPHVYDVPHRLRPDHWALAGDWTLERENAALNAAGGRLLFRFLARDLHLVAGPGARAAPVRFRLSIDGHPPGTDHGLDVDEEGRGAVAEQRLHQLVRQHGDVTERSLEVRFLDPGVRVYSFTFG